MSQPETRRVSGDGESERIQFVAHLVLVLDGRAVGAADGLTRHTSDGDTSSINLRIDKYLTSYR